MTRQTILFVSDNALFVGLLWSFDEWSIDYLTLCKTYSNARRGKSFKQEFFQNLLLAKFF